LRLIGLWNAKGIEGTSGGDVCFQELWKRFDCNKVLVTPKETKQPICFTYAYIKRLITNWRLPYGDIVYASSDFPPDVVPAYLSGKPWVQKIYHIIPRKGISYMAQKFCFELIKQRCNLIIAGSKLLKTQLIDLGFPNRIEVVYPGIMPKGSPIPLPKRYDAVFLGRLQKSKGIDDLAKIWELVNKVLPEAKLAVIGNGNMKPQNNIDLMGYLSEENKENILRSSRVFISTSHEEGFGLAIAEAMSYGLPVIAWNLPIYDEIFGNHILKIPMLSHTLFYLQLYNLIQTPSYDAISRVNREYIKKYNWDKSAEQEMKLICDLYTSSKGASNSFTTLYSNKEPLSSTGNPINSSIVYGM
jgi:glycosyltransferase involved in cell wall biosynthesis